jgi:hypothetical protein
MLTHQDYVKMDDAFLVYPQSLKTVPCLRVLQFILFHKSNKQLESVSNRQTCAKDATLPFG